MRKVLLTLLGALFLFSPAVGRQAPQAQVVNMLEYTTAPVGGKANELFDVQEFTPEIYGEILQVQVIFNNCPSGMSFFLRDPLLADAYLRNGARHYIVSLAAYPAPNVFYENVVVYPHHVANWSAQDMLIQSYPNLNVGELYPVAGKLQIDLEDIDADATATVRIWYR